MRTRFPLIPYAFIIGPSFPHHKLKLHLEQDSEFFPAHQQKLGWLSKVNSMIIEDFSNI